MFESLKGALRAKELRNKILFTLFIILVVRLGSQIPVPGIDTQYFKQWFAKNGGSAFNIISAFTGGSFERFSLLALGVTPYITSSIIIQLLTIAIPALEELHKDGEHGRKKLEKITRYLAIGLSLMESIAMAIGFGRSRIIPNMSIPRGILVVVCLTAGSALIILLGMAIDKKGIGNGISIILMVNILSGIPSDIISLINLFVYGKKPAKATLAVVIIVAIILLTIIFVIALNEAYRKVPVQYIGKMAGKKSFMGQSSFIPVKVNMSSVIPVIFASSLLSIPQMFASFLGKGYGSGFSKFFLNAINQNNWFSRTNPEYSLGLLLYVPLIIFFAYFYTSISFNPIEIADNLKKSGASIPGIRAGKPTEEYLGKVIGRMVFIGAVGLIIVVLIPIVSSGMFGANVSFGGTSLIIIVGVILETLEKIESEMQVHNYKGFIA